MAVRIELPSQPSGSTEEQLVKLYSYLYQMAKMMNLNLEEIGDTTLSDAELELMNQLTVNHQTSQTDETVPPGYNYKEHQTLKSLIIKTADFVKTAVDAYRITLFGEEKASSEFGTYLQKKGVKVDVTPDGVKQTYSFSEVVKGLKNFEINAKNYIKTGYLRTENSTPIYGVAIGKDVVTFADNGAETYHDGNKVAELTDDALSFFQNGTIVAKYAGTKTSFYSGGTEVMYIQNGKIYSTIDLEIASGKKIKLGEWEINEDGLYGVVHEDEYSSQNIYIGGHDISNVRDCAIFNGYGRGVGLFYKMTTGYGADYVGTLGLQAVQDPWNTGAIGGTYYPVLDLYGKSNGGLYQQKAIIGLENRRPDGCLDTVNYNLLVQNSSRDKKKEIEPIPDPGGRLDQLEPVSFIYKDDEKEKRHQGLIYEDTVAIMPEICSGQGEPKTISYIELVPILLKEIQSLRRRIKALEEKED